MIAFALVILGSAFAQQRLTEAKLERTTLRPNAEYVVRMEPFDDAVSLDPGSLAIEVDGPDRLRLKSSGPGIYSFIVLRGGETQTYILEVAHSKTGSVAFEDVSTQPVDGIPIVHVSGSTQLSRRKNGASTRVSVLGAGADYRSTELGLQAGASVAVQELDGGFWLGSLNAYARRPTFDLLLGDHSVGDATGRFQAQVRGVDVTIRPNGDRSGFGAQIGVSRPASCCGLVDANGDVVASVHGQIGLGAGQLEARAGTFIDLRDGAFEPLTSLRYRFGSRTASLAMGVGTRGPAFVAGADGGYRKGPTQLRFIGSFEQRGAYNGRGIRSQADRVLTTGYGVQRVSDLTRVGLIGAVASVISDALTQTDVSPGAFAIFGNRATMRVGYDTLITTRSDTGLEVGHRVGAAFRGDRTRRVRQNALARFVYRPSVGLSAQGLANVDWPIGPGAFVGTNLVVNATESSGTAFFRANTSLERSRIAADAGAFSRVGSLAGKPQFGLGVDSSVNAKVSRWLSVNGNATVQQGLVGDQDLTYTVGAGFRTVVSADALIGPLVGRSFVGGRVFVDLDGDGAFSEGDYGVQNIPVTVAGRSAVTDADGVFRIRALQPGTFEVGVDPLGFVLADTLPSVTVTAWRPGRLEIPLVRSKRMDFRVFGDLNRNGERDLGELPVSAEGIEVVGPDGTVLVDAVRGVGTLSGVSQGVYSVTLDPLGVDEGYVPLVAESVAVRVRERGFEGVNLPVYPIRRVIGRVCDDSNRNGRFEPADFCAPGVVVRLSTGATTKTREEGRFVFDDVPAGEHVVSTAGAQDATVRFNVTPKSVRDVVLLRQPAESAPSPVPTKSGDIAPVAAVRLRLPHTELKVSEAMDFAVEVTRKDLSQSESSDLRLQISSGGLEQVGSRLMGRKPGTYEVYAVVGGVSSPKVQVRVRNLPVVSLIANPVEIDVPVGEVETVAASALYVNGETQDVLDRVEWTSSDPLVAKVEGNGVVVGVGPGRAIVRGSYLGISSSPIEVRVNPGDAVPTRMAVAPEALVLGIESTGRLYVDAELSSGREVQLATEVEWFTTDPGVLEVLPGGRIRPISVGEAEVFAEFRGVRSSTSTVRIVPAVGLLIEPALNVVPAGAKVPIRAFEVLEDGTYREITKAKWTSDVPSVARVEEGAVVTDQVGTARISAKYRGSEAIPIEVEVIASPARNIRISQEVVRLEAGKKAFVDAVVEFDDGREAVSTNVVTWRSDNPEVARINADGVITAVGPGRTRVNARWLGLSGAPVVVLVDAGVDEVPVAVLVEPGEVELSAEGRTPLAVSAVTELGIAVPAKSVRWEVADPSVAWVEDGEVRAVSVGTTELVAVQGDVRSQPVRVTVKPIIGVTAEPPLGRLPVGARVDLQAIGVVDDGGVEELSSGVRWTSSNPEVLRIDANGELLAFKAGRATVTAVWRGLETLPMPVEVADTDLAGLTIDPGQASLRVDERLPLAVVAVFGDGQVADGSPHVTWTSTRPGIARVDEGVVTGLQPGVSEVYATWMGVQSELMRVTVAPADAVGVILGNASEVMLIGRRIPLRATAVTEDGKLLNASDQTIWGVGDDSVVRVDANGYIEALAPGETTVVGIVAGQESPPVRVEVTGAALVQLIVKPGALAVRTGDPVELVVEALLQDGRTVDVTPQVDWEIDGRGVAVDRYNQLVVGADARARVRARIDDVRSGWSEIVATD